MLAWVLNGLERGIDKPGHLDGMLRAIGRLGRSVCGMGAVADEAKL
jgi:hypothetical protein